MSVHPHGTRSSSGSSSGRSSGLVVVGLLSTLLAMGAGSGPVRAQQQGGYGQTMGSSPMENQIYNNDPGSGTRPGGSSGGLNPANPLDLINRIRKNSSLDNATPPGDAVDQALRELETQTGPKPAPQPSGPVVVSPRPAGAAAATP